MEKIKVVVVGYGNVGKLAVDAVLESKDMELIGIISTSCELENVFVTDNIKNIKNKVDVAILCIPTRKVLEVAKEYLALGINTVDSFDIHGSILELRSELDVIAKANNCVSIISAGWDPGSDSVIRTLLEACSPRGITYTNFGPGMSMGHSVVAKSFDGVKNALSMTMPLGAGIHRRMVYVELENGVSFEKIEKEIKADSYFASDETHIIKVDDISKVMDVGHSVNLIRKGVSGKTHNQLFEFTMKINNPALTSQIMVACGRGTLKQSPGAYTLIEIPVIDLLEGTREDAIKRLV